ncbi:hypothetical protein AC249_AIPGENE19406 [Exaiptasia diaphana]|nr:hypothetical protein AC249_AIPGENE19406 [Exaiptasia diaphana]
MAQAVQPTMKKFVVGLLLMVIIVDMFCPSEAWWGSRRRSRRRSPPPPPPPPPPCNLKMKHHGWKNDFDGHLKFKCSPALHLGAQTGIQDIVRLKVIGESKKKSRQSLLFAVEMAEEKELQVEQ